MSTLRRRNINFDDKQNENTAATIDASSIVTVDKDPRQRKLETISAKVDRILQLYVKFTSSAANQDKVLKVLQYSLWLLSRFYFNSFRSGLEKLSDEICWARYVNRFFGLPASMEGVSSGSWGSPKVFGKAMAWTMIGYYPLEHLAYLKWKAPEICMPSRSDSRLAAKFSAWSCRFWLAYLVLDILRSRNALLKTEKDEETAAGEASRTERIQILRNALFFLPAINWSLPNWDTKPILSSGVCNGLMFLESIVCLHQGISNTLKS